MNDEQDEYLIAAEAFGTPFISQIELCRVAKVNRTTFWHLPDEQKPKMFRMGGHLMIQPMDAAKWARWYNEQCRKRPPKGEA